MRRPFGGKICGLLLGVSHYSIFLHRLLQSGKCYEEVKCGDLAKISLKLFKSQIAIDLWKYHLQIFKVPSKITPNSIWLENMICKSKSIT